MQIDKEPEPDPNFERYFLHQVEEAARALFSLLDPGTEPCARLAEDLRGKSAGVVGFFGPRVRGSISVAIAGGDSDPLREDRANELANQLTGRVKNRLWRVGVAYEIAPPVTLRGRQISITSRENESRFCFKGPIHTYSVHAALDVFAEVGMKPVAPDETPLDEGDLLLF
ncbi:MAG TPA: chemotaxis protein CheX [Planctomycetota bacterium]|nr:chemotaxis protein CheX [Planctomycetota bacterium]